GSVKFDCHFPIRRGLDILTLLCIGLTPHQVGFCIPGVKSNRLIEVRYSSVIIALLGVGAATVVGTKGIVLVEPDRLIQISNCPIQLSHLLVSASSIAICHRILRIKSEGFVKVVDGFTVILEVETGSSAPGIVPFSLCVERRSNPYCFRELGFC